MSSVLNLCSSNINYADEEDVSAEDILAPIFQ